uniref:ODV-EC27 n=1 Tax=Strongyloides papillosus TaxID=174720 RepID=A0A0N5C6W6_STREA
MTLKAHQVTHIAEILQRHGSLCNYSCFFGEELAYNLTKIISLKILDKSLNQLKTRLTDYNVINSMVIQIEKEKPKVIKQMKTRMCVREFCHSHFANCRLEVEELSESNFKSYIIKPAYDMLFRKNSFVAFECDKSTFKCAIGVIKSIVSVETNVFFIVKPLKIKSILLDRFPVNSNENVINQIKDNTIFDYYFCLEEYMDKAEITSYRPMNFFANETSHLIVLEKNAILYKCLIINTSSKKSFCCQ